MGPRQALDTCTIPVEASTSTFAHCNIMVFRDMFGFLWMLSSTESLLSFLSLVTIHFIKCFTSDKTHS